LNGGGVALKEIVDMAALGRVKTLLDRYPLSAVKQAYDDFKQGHLIGRAVVIPEAVEARAA
jgi:D-arabinose 1-dehydrogenase-like Zn-dependent alcohol dehydrogenase